MAWQKTLPILCSRQDRLQNDIKNVLSAFSATDASIDTNSNKDCHWLGKYSAQSDCPRSLLVKLLRYTDASSIIRNKLNLLLKFM